VPSDLVVSLASIHAIPMPVAEMPLLHPTLNDDPAVFTDFVLPLLQSPPAVAWQVADPSAAASSTTPGQFTRVYTGHLQPGETNDLIINIDPGVTVATFALYDSSRSLTTTVTGANGNTIQLDAVANGEIRVTDAEMMVYLGYGFVQPRAGQWIVTLQPTADTPAAGADYAITAQFHGGATLQTTVDQLLPAVNQPVTVQAQLTAAGQPIALTAAEANVRQPDGQLTTYPLVMAGATATLTLAPAQSGLHGVEVSVRAQTVDGLTIDRASFTLFEAQPTLIEARFRLGSALPFLLFLVFILLLPLILLVVFVL
jgi:hypothetical protein